jgi:hypothetical protein
MAAHITWGKRKKTERLFLAELVGEGAEQGTFV